MKKISIILMAAVSASLLGTGCVTATSSSKPLAYVSVVRPQGIIKTTDQKTVSKDFKRGGMYVGNFNFRPAPDLAGYLNDLSSAVGSPVVKNADAQLSVPFAFDILFFGFNMATDTATAQGRCQ